LAFLYLRSLSAVKDFIVLYLVYILYLVNLHTADRCTRALYSNVYSAVWYRSRCYLTFSDRRTWLDAATKCVNRRGNLASYHTVDTITLPFFRATNIPHSCAWIGLVNDYLHWMTPGSSQGQLLSTNTLEFGSLTAASWVKKVMVQEGKKS